MPFVVRCLAEVIVLVKIQEAQVQGVGFVLCEGRILVRESGTEPVVRVMVEAEDKETCRNLVESVIRVIKEKGYAAK